MLQRPHSITPFGGTSQQWSRWGIPNINSRYTPTTQNYGSTHHGSTLFKLCHLLFVTRLCFEVIDQIRLNFLWKILIFSFVVRHSSHFQKSFTMALGGSHTLQKTWTIPIKGSHNIFIMNQQFVPVSKQK